MSDVTNVVRDRDGQAAQRVLDGQARRAHGQSLPARHDGRDAGAGA